MCEQREAQTSNVKLPLHPATHFPALLGHAMSDYRRERQNDGRIIARDLRWTPGGGVVAQRLLPAVPRRWPISQARGHRGSPHLKIPVDDHRRPRMQVVQSARNIVGPPHYVCVVVSL